MMSKERVESNNSKQGQILLLTLVVRIAEQSLQGMANSVFNLSFQNKWWNQSIIIAARRESASKQCARNIGDEDLIHPSHDPVEIGDRQGPVQTPG